MGSVGNKQEREVRTDLTRRQLKLHVTSQLKKAGLSKAESYSTAIRGYKSVSKSGYVWGDDYNGLFNPSIRYIGGMWTTSDKEKAYLDRVENALSSDFKIKRNEYSVEILGEYEKRR